MHVADRHCAGPHGEKALHGCVGVCMCTPVRVWQLHVLRHRHTRGSSDLPHRTRPWRSEAVITLMKQQIRKSHRNFVALTEGGENSSFSPLSVSRERSLIFCARFRRRTCVKNIHDVASLLGSAVLWGSWAPSREMLQHPLLRPSRMVWVTTPERLLQTML